MARALSSVTSSMGITQDVEGLVDHLPALAGDGDLVADEGDLAHVDADQTGGVVLDLDVHNAAYGLDLEVLRRNVFLLEEVFGEDTQTIAAFFGLAAVGVQDTHRGHVTREVRPVQNAVRPHTEIPVANQPDIRFAHREVLHVRIDHQIIVAQPVVFLEVYVHMLLSWKSQGEARPTDSHPNYE